MAIFSCACHDRRLGSSPLCNRHCSNFFRSDAGDVSSIQASQHQKMGLRGNNCGRLDFNWDDINSLSVNKSLWELATTAAIAFSFLLMAVILLPLPYCYLGFLHLHCFKILVWNSSPFPWCCQYDWLWHIVTIVSLLLWLPYVISTFLWLYTQPFFPEIIFYSSIPHKLAC